MLEADAREKTSHVNVIGIKLYKILDSSHIRLPASQTQQDSRPFNQTDPPLQPYMLWYQAIDKPKCGQGECATCEVTKYKCVQFVVYNSH